MIKKVTIIFGSPTKESNTHILVKEAQKGLKESGVESEIIFLNDLQMKGCQSCLSCKVNDTTKCAVKDDMQAVYQAMEASDGIIVATPIYFSDVTAQTKLWMDRLFPYLGTRGGVSDGKPMVLMGRMPGNKRAKFIFTQNQPDPELFKEHMATFMKTVGMVGFDVKGYMIAANLYRGVKPMVTENESAMMAAYNLGKHYFE